MDKIKNKIKNKLTEIYSNYLDDDKLNNIEKYILEKFKKYEYKGRSVRLYYKNNIFAKIDERKTNQLKYEFNDNSLILGKFPKEIIIIYLLRRVLPNNIIKIKKYYFNSNKQILIMKNIPLTLDEFIKNKNDIDTINLIFIQIFLIIAIFQYKYKFIHNDLSTKNILLRKTNESTNYKLNGKIYTIKCRYMPVLIDFATSGTHEINKEEFVIYDTESMNNKNVYKNKYEFKITDKNYRWYLLDNNIYDPFFDIYYMIKHIDIQVPIIEEYKKLYNNIIDFIDNSAVFRSFL